MIFYATNYKKQKQNILPYKYLCQEQGPSPPLMWYTVLYTNFEHFLIFQNVSLMMTFQKLKHAVGDNAGVLTNTDLCLTL